VNLAHAIEAYDGSIVLRGEHAQTGRSANKMCTAGGKNSSALSTATLLGCVFAHFNGIIPIGLQVQGERVIRVSHQRLVQCTQNAAFRRARPPHTHT